MRTSLRWQRCVWVVGVCTGVALLAASTVRAAEDTRSASKIQRGFELAEEIGLSLNLQGKNRALVGLGSYIVNAQGGCNDCHTHPSYQPGHDPFQGQPEQINTAGYLAGGRVFIAPAPYPLGLAGCVISRNLTPFLNGLPAGLTFEQFQQVLQTGEDAKDTTHRPPRLLQVMPWPVLGKMTDRDLRAVYEFLRAIPPIDSEPPCP